MIQPSVRTGAVALLCTLLAACGSGNHPSVSRAKAVSHNHSTPLDLTGESLFANAKGSTVAVTANGVIGSVRVPTKGPRAGQTLIAVDGVKFNVTDAVISRGAATLTVDSLRAGQPVSITGVLKRGSSVADATEVAVAPGVIGIVEAVDVATQSVQVSGQTVYVDDATVYLGEIADGEFTAIDQLAEGNFVDVIGVVNADGSIQAGEMAYVAEAFVPDEMTIVINGVISALDADAKTFSINAATIDYSTAELVDFPVDDAGNPIVADDQSIIVESTAGVNDDGAIVATTLRFVDAAADATVDVVGSSVVIVQGRVSASDPQSIVVNGVTISLGTATINSTVRVAGRARTIAVNAFVTVTGQVDANGVIVAQDITVMNGDIAVKLTAPVDAYDAESGVMTFLGALEITVTEDTMFEETTLDDIVAALDAGEMPMLEVEADMHEDGALVAHNIEMEDDEVMVKLRGPAANIDPDGMSFDIVGVPVAVGDDTLYVLDGAEVAAEDFFAALAEAGDGTTVKTHGDFDADAGTLMAHALILKLEMAGNGATQSANTARNGSAPTPTAGTSAASSAGPSRTPSPRR